jgi:hypothetical protein
MFRVNILRMLALRIVKKRSCYIRRHNDVTIGVRLNAFYRHYNSSDPDVLRDYLHITRTQFDKLFGLIELSMNARRHRKKCHRYTIKNKERLAIFLRQYICTKGENVQGGAKKTRPRP